ncbi:MAG: hypothetical protein ABI261_01755, partial [Ginsengibacter sp.]
PFVLYGRTNQSIVSGNKIMFKGLEEGETLINCSSDNGTLKNMQPVFNKDANCIDYPVVLKNTNDNQNFYFAKHSENQVYEFENNQGYNDFIIMFIEQKKNQDLYANIKDDGNSLLIEGKIIIKKTVDEKTNIEFDQMSKMYDRVHPQSENYYCNPAYNVFEEYGININKYQKEILGKEYYYVNKSYEEEGVDDYHKMSVIYEYKKITPNVSTDKKYTIKRGSIFTYKCAN